MHDKINQDLNILSPEEFITYAQKLGNETLWGYIRYDPKMPNDILYTNIPFSCPNTPISKDIIDNVKIGKTWTTSCGNAWDAVIYFKKSSDYKALFGKNTEIIEKLIKLIVFLQQSCLATPTTSKCSCHSLFKSDSSKR